MDIRFKRLLEDIIIPPTKEGMKPRSMAYLKLAFMSKINCFLLASFPKSGLHWTGDVLSYCLSKKFLGKFEIKYEGSGNLPARQKKRYDLFLPADSRAAGRKKIREKFPGVDLDYCLHTHNFWKDSPLWRLDEAKTLFIVRNIPTVLYSDFRTKSQKRPFKDFRHYLEDGALDRIIKFFSTWGDFCESPGAKFKIIKYEDLRSNPKNNFSKIYEFAFAQKIEEGILDEALNYFSFEKQKEREFKFNSDEEKHFLFKGAYDYNEYIPPQDLNLIYTRIKNELKNTFGYEYPEGV